MLDEDEASIISALSYAVVRPDLLDYRQFTNAGSQFPGAADKDEAADTVRENQRDVGTLKESSVLAIAKAWLGCRNISADVVRHGIVCRACPRHHDWLDSICQH
jgi:hypothetical protein